MCIDATNEQAKDNLEFQKQMGQMETSDKRRGIFFAIDRHLPLLRYPQRRKAWSTDPLKEQKEVKKLCPSSNIVC